MSDVRILGEIAVRTGMLTVACSRCERSGRYRLDTLIGRHGADAPGARHRSRANGWLPATGIARADGAVRHFVSRATNAVLGPLRALAYRVA